MLGLNVTSRSNNSTQTNSTKNTAKLNANKLYLILLKFSQFL